MIVSQRLASSFCVQYCFLYRNLFFLIFVVLLSDTFLIKKSCISLLIFIHLIMLNELDNENLAVNHYANYLSLI